MPRLSSAEARPAARRRFFTAVLVASLVCTGCSAAPRTVEMTLDFTQDGVTLTAALKDVRTFAPDPLNQALTFGQLSSPRPEWFTRLPWLPQPSSYAWQSAGDGVDLHVRATMPRAQFDACARDACGKRAERACRSFPVQLCNGEYSVDPEVLSSQAIRVLPGSRSTWSHTAPSTSFRFALTSDAAKVLEDGPSLQQGALFFERHPAEAAELMRLAEAYQRAFRRQDWKAAAALVRGSAPCVADPLVCRLKEEVFRREQSALLNAYLARYEPWGLSPAPPRGDLWLDNPHAEAVPLKPLPEVATLRLRVLYEVSQRNSAQTGFLADITEKLVEVCSSTRRKQAKDQRAFCGALTLASHPEGLAR